MDNSSVRSPLPAFLLVTVNKGLTIWPARSHGETLGSALMLPILE
jgi:hypothetical protein